MKRHLREGNIIMNLNVFFPENLMIQSIENNEHKILIDLKSESNFNHYPLCDMKS